MPNTITSHRPSSCPDPGPSTAGVARSALELVLWVTVAWLRLYLWLLGCVIKAPVWILFALCGHHYVVRRNGKTSRVSVWR